MALADIRSNLIEIVAFNSPITSDTTTTSSFIDTAEFELGLMFSVNLSEFNAGTFTLQLLESDDTIIGNATVISGDQLIGPLPVLTAVTANTTALQTVGVISNKRYVWARIVSTGSTSGNNRITVVSTQKGENLPI